MSQSIKSWTNRDLKQSILHFWAKFGNPSLNGWWVIAWTDTDNDNTQRPKLSSSKNSCNYLSMLGLKLNHVSERGPCYLFIFQGCCFFANLRAITWLITPLSHCHSNNSEVYGLKWPAPYKYQVLKRKCSHVTKFGVVTQVQPITTRVLIQYKDVILPVYEMSLWR